MDTNIVNKNKQHLCNIWSSIHAHSFRLKFIQHWGWVEKKGLLIKKKACKWKSTVNYSHVVEIIISGKNSLSLLLFEVKMARLMMTLQYYELLRSSRPEVLCERGVLKNFAKFTGKHPCQSLYVNKFAGLRLWEQVEHLRWLLIFIVKNC